MIYLNWVVSYFGIHFRIVMMNLRRFASDSIERQFDRHSSSANTGPKTFFCALAVHRPRILAVTIAPSSQPLRREG
jgi:hypothetical protein